MPILFLLNNSSNTIGFNLDSFKGGYTRTMQFIKDFIYCTVAPQKMVMVVVNKQYIDVYIF